MTPKIVFSLIYQIKIEYSTALGSTLLLWAKYRYHILSSSQIDVHNVPMHLFHTYILHKNFSFTVTLYSKCLLISLWQINIIPVYIFFIVIFEFTQKQGIFRMRGEFILWTFIFNFLSNLVIFLIVVVF